MLKLAYPIDNKVIIDNKEYRLDLMFDNVLRLIDMINDKTLQDVEKIQLGLLILLGNEFKDYSIQDKELIFTNLIERILERDTKDSRDVDIEGNPMPRVKEESNYSIKEDGDYIYASFMSDYGIDLIDMQGKLHWYKFRALLSGLTDASKFSRVIEIRDMELPKGRGSQKDRERIKELKRQYAVKDVE